MTDRRLIRIKLVKRTLGAAAVAALLAGPMALTLTESESTSPERPDVPRLVAQHQDAERVEESPEVALLAPEPTEAAEARQEPLTGPAAARAEVARLRQASRQELLELARTGGDLERLSAVSVLWARGEQTAVEALVADAADDRVLLAKLEALRTAK